MKKLTKMILVSGLLLIAGRSYAGSILGNDTLIIKGSCITLKTSLPGDATWSTGDKGSSIKVCPDGNQRIWVKVKGKDGKTYTDTLKISVDDNPVLPGDVNDNGKVTLKDVLMLGIAYGAKGSTRPGASNKWTKQAAYDWKSSFKDDVNYKHADCNGDGVVDTSDLVVISKNFGKSSGKSGTINLASGSSPLLALKATKDTVHAGDTLHVLILLGTPTTPSNNTYGVSLAIQFDPNIVYPGTMQLGTTNSWMSLTPNDLLAFNNADYSGGNGNLAISRMNQVAVSGNGRIGDLSIVVKGDIVGKDAINKMLRLAIVDAQTIDPQENITILNTKDAEVAVVAKQTSAINETVNNTNAVNIYPNPNNGNFTIDLKGNKADKIEMTDMLGRTQLIINRPSGQMINVSPSTDLKKGMYVVRVYNGNEINITPITIVK